MYVLFSHKNLKVDYVRIIKPNKPVRAACFIFHRFKIKSTDFYIIFKHPSLRIPNYI